MLKPLHTQPLPAPLKRSSNDNIKKADKHSDEKSVVSQKSDKQSKKDLFAAHLDNELEKQDLGVDAGVAQVEESDLSAEVLGDAPLKTELQASANMKAQPISLEGINTELAVPVNTEPTPKLLDAKLIEQVNDVIAPESVDVTKLENTDFPLTMKELLGQPKGQGRAPAIDFAKAEVDPQLMNMEDFVAQKNAFTNKQLTTQAYGMPTKGMPMTAELRSSAEAKKLQQGLDVVLASDVNAAGVTGLTAAALAIEGVGQAEKLDVGVNSQAKVFDMNSLKGQKLDAETVMTQITDYVMQARASKEPSVSMKMNHQDLGMIDLTVNRTGNNMVSIALGAQDQNARAFLGQHRDSLMNHLTQAGVTVTDLKVELQSASRENASNQQHASNGQGQTSQQQYGSESNQRRQEQQRREDLWNVLREKEVA